MSDAVLSPVCYVPSSAVVAAPVGEELILLDLRSGTYFSLNPVGARLWDGVARGESGAAIAEAIVREYEVSIEIASRDIESFLDRLIEAGLLQRL